MFSYPFSNFIHSLIPSFIHSPVVWLTLTGHLVCPRAAGAEGSQAPHLLWSGSRPGAGTALSSEARAV